MLKVLTGAWLKPDKQAAYESAVERGKQLDMEAWVLPRDSLELGSRLGQGGFGTVFNCKIEGRGKAVAKRITPAKLAPKDLPLLRN